MSEKLPEYLDPNDKVTFLLLTLSNIMIASNEVLEGFLDDESQLS